MSASTLGIAVVVGTPGRTLLARLRRWRRAYSVRRAEVVGYRAYLATWDNRLARVLATLAPDAMRPATVQALCWAAPDITAPFLGLLLASVRESGLRLTVLKGDNLAIAAADLRHGQRLRSWLRARLRRVQGDDLLRTRVHLLGALDDSAAFAHTHGGALLLYAHCHGASIGGDAVRRAARQKG